MFLRGVFSLLDRKGWAKKKKSLVYKTIVEGLPSMPEALGLIPSTTLKKKRTTLNK